MGSGNQSIDNLFLVITDIHQIYSTSDRFILLYPSLGHLTIRNVLYLSNVLL